MNKKKIPLYIADLQDGDGLKYLSIVKRPATHLQWKVLGHADGRLKVFAPILPANTPIYRRDDANGEYYALFTPQVIADTVERYAGERIRFDVEHSEIPVDDVRIVESFIIDYRRKTLYNDYFGLTDGSWVMVLSLPDELIPKWGTWDELLTPKVNGDTPQNMINMKQENNIRSDDFSGISISGIFSYTELSLQEAVEMYNVLKI